MSKIYYAHPISIYNTKQEDRDIELLNKLFPDHLIYNPSKDENASDGYEMCGMDYFFGEITDCSILAFRSFPDGNIPKGVYSEIEAAKELEMPVIELPSYYNRKLSVDDTRQYLIESGCR